MSFGELLALLRKHLRFMIAVPVACAVAMAIFSIVFMHNVYTAETSLYVVASSDQESSSNLQSDLSASQMVSNDVAKLFEKQSIIKQSAQDCGLEDLDDYSMSVSAEDTSRVIDLSVTGPTPEGSAQVANAIAKNVADLAEQVMSVQGVNIIEEAAVPEEKSGPSRSVYVVVAFVIGLVAAEMVVYLREILNTRIRTPEELEERYGIPVIGRIPVSKGGK